jgi:hypothetical protein
VASSRSFSSAFEIAAGLLTFAQMLGQIAVRKSHVKGGSNLLFERAGAEGLFPPQQRAENKGPDVVFK